MLSNLFIFTVTSVTMYLLELSLPMHTLPELKFNPEAFSDWTSAKTFEVHHGKHHAGYVKKLNDALSGHDLGNANIIDTVNALRESDKNTFNLAAQHFNHSFFWNCLSETTTAPSEKIIQLIDRDFGGMEEFREAFTKLASSHFGSGWVWLVQNPAGKLEIKDYHDAQTPAGTNLTPLLTLDVWEHAYYLDFKNDRGGFIDGFWSHVNWQFVEESLV